MTYEQWLTALCIWREARGEPIETKRAIWWVIYNRMNDEHRRWPRTIDAVILQRAQFSSFSSGDANATRFPIGSVPDSADWKAFLDCQTVVLETHLGDPTAGATFYESEPTPPDPEKQPWFDPANLTLTAGRTRFYRS